MGESVGLDHWESDGDGEVGRGFCYKRSWILADQVSTYSTQVVVPASGFVHL